MIAHGGACYDRGQFLTGTSAAQNGPVIRICPKCGALALNNAENCEFCEDSAEIEKSIPPVAAKSKKSEPMPEWQDEVTRRLEKYRARRQHLNPDEGQPNLPFRKLPERQETQIFERPRTRSAQRPRQTERLEICVQPELDFSSASNERVRPLTALVPVANFYTRRRAMLLDLLFLGLTCGGFAVLFRALGGELGLEKTDALVYGSVLYLFYALYFSLFTIFAGATPGMQLSGLTIVQLDGTLPDTRQLLWRSFGYLLSAATLMFGFVWALWDEDHFSWQDRISHTYVTSATPLLH